MSIETPQISKQFQNILSGYVTEDSRILAELLLSLDIRDQGDKNHLQKCSNAPRDGWPTRPLCGDFCR